MTCLLTWWRNRSLRSTRRLGRRMWGPDAPTDFHEITARALREHIVTEQDLFDAACEGIAKRNKLGRRPAVGTH